MNIKDYLSYNPDTGLFTWIKRKPRSPISVGDIAGHKNARGYIEIRFEGTLYLAHRLAFLFMTGSMPDYVDHEDEDKSNNKWLNLRAATKAQNGHNVGIGSRNTSGVKGVSFYKPNGKWLAQIVHQGKNYYLGYHEDIETAKMVVINKRAELHGEFANNG
ncbi:HNH homing endonuclease [Hafnia phage vB_HalM_SPARTY]|nr:HNH homing endonuclease [Hafnia phage vB_HalM_SPARTY]